MRTTNRTRIAAVLLAGVTGLALTACSSSSNDDTAGSVVQRLRDGDAVGHARRRWPTAA